MTDYIIGVWYDSSTGRDDGWVVTVHNSRRSGGNKAYFFKRYYSKFKTRKEADVYADMLFYKWCLKDNRVRLISPRQYDDDDALNRTQFGEYVSETGRHHFPRMIDKRFMDGVATVLKNEQEHWT